MQRNVSYFGQILQIIIQGDIEGKRSPRRRMDWLQDSKSWTKKSSLQRITGR